MLLEEFCVKVYWWPFLSYLASIKGLCPLYPTGYYPIYPLPPPPPPPPPPQPVTLIPFPSSTSAVIPTFQPTPPPLTLPPFPPPLTTTTTTTTSTSSTSSTTTSAATTTTSTAGTTLPVPTTCPSQPFVCLPGGVPPLPNCPCIDPRQQQQQPQQLRATVGSDMMIFVPLNPGRRRRRRPQQQSCYDARSRSGSCVPLTSCAQLLEQVQTGASSEFQTFLGQSICGFDGSSFLVCCAEQRAPLISRSPKEYVPPTSSSLGAFQFSPLGVPTIQSPQSTPMVFQPTPPFNQGALVIRPTPALPAPGFPSASPSGNSVCGIGGATTNRVVGGLPVRKGAYPWMAALGYYDENNRSALKFLCAGSLISAQFVITSAHCINPTLTLVRLGAHDLTKAAEQGAIDYRIRRSIVHENFDLASIANDIALIELNGEAPSNGDIRPICLPEGNNFQREDAFVGMHPFVAGYGATKHQGATSNVLRDAQVPIVSRQSCEQNYKSVFQFVQFSDKLICAGSSTVDACQGDSGGPLMMPQLDGGGYRFYLLGIVSFGYECARPGFPGVYTRVSSYLGWIHNKLNSQRGKRR
ncbi:venom serine protease Bi-VSP [Drosophila albomicans]|uniref:Acrosin n=1 Tax=Drosophila albomicans TaxID=7291 RepID=A0A9C6T5C9_DROAB|nr:venom serine protease Bi-VSP [Drosophila albomicans]